MKNKKILSIFIIITVTVSLLLAIVFFKPQLPWALVGSDFNKYTKYYKVTMTYRTSGDKLNNIVTLTSNNFDFSVLYNEHDFRFFDDTNKDGIGDNLLPYHVLEFSITKQYARIYVHIAEWIGSWDNPETPEKENQKIFYLAAGYIGSDGPLPDGSDSSIFTRFNDFENDRTGWFPVSSTSLKYDNTVVYHGATSLKWMGPGEYTSSGAYLEASDWAQIPRTTIIRFYLRWNRADYSQDTWVYINYGGRHVAKIHIYSYFWIYFAGTTRYEPSFRPANNHWYEFLFYINGETGFFEYFSLVDKSVADTSQYTYELTHMQFDGDDPLGQTPENGIKFVSTQYNYGEWFLDYFIETKFAYPDAVYTTVEYIPPAPHISLITTPLEFPSGAVNQEIELKLTFDGVPMQGASIIMTIQGKGNYVGDIFTGTLTDTNGYSKIVFNAPPYLDPVTLEVLSPYDIIIEAKNGTELLDTYTTQLYVVPAIDVRFIDANSPQQYNTAGEDDLYIKVSVIEDQTNTPIIASSVTTLVTITTDMGETIIPTVRPSSTTSDIEITAKVWNQVGTTDTRTLNITVTCSKSGYYTGKRSTTIQMVAPTMNILIKLSPTFSVGTKGFYVSFENPDGSPYEFSPTVLSNIDNYITVSIIKMPEETEYFNPDYFTITYLETAYEHAIFVDYTFTDTGDYKIIVKTQNMDVVKTQYKLVEVAESFIPTFAMNPYIWIAGIIVLGLIYLLFFRGKKKEYAMEGF